MLAEALEAEVEGYLERHREARGQDGHALVVRNGRSPARQVTVGAGRLAVEAPRVNDQRMIRGDRQRFTSQILPPYLRKVAGDHGTSAGALPARTLDGGV